MKEYKLGWKFDKWIETKSEESMVQHKMDKVHIFLDEHEFNDPQSVTFKSFLEDYLNALTCNDDVKPKFKVYAESRLTEILGNTPLQIKESAKQLQGVLDELQGYVEKIKEKLLVECSLGKENFTVIASEYPMDLMIGNINDIICKVLVDFYGNTN